MAELTSAEDDLLAAEHCDVSRLIRQWLKRDDVSGGELRRLKALRGAVQRANDESASAIKNNVFQNYKQFIETAKDISYLEGEMYQLNHLLTEQKNLIEQMTDLSFSETGKLTNVKSNKLDGGRGTMSENEKKKSMQSLLERVEGANHLADNPNRCILMEGDLAELNGESSAVIRNVHCFLMNDGIMITSWVSHRLGALRYKLEAFHPMENIAAANVKETGGRNIFKLFVFPEHKYYACDTARTKREWLDGIDGAKRAMLQQGSLVRQATIRNKRRSLTTATSPISPTNNPFDTTTTTEESAGGTAELTKANSLEEGGAEWLRELPDELDVCIAQRDFEQALELLFEGTVLGRELRTVGQGGGPKAQSKAITLLVRLGRSAQACDLYLKNRTATIKTALKEVRIAEDPLNYLRHVSRIVFGALADVAGEFPRLFANHPGCCAVLLRWASAEMKSFVTLLLRHVFDPGPSLMVIGQCVTSVLSQAEKLASLGLDLRFEVDTLLTPSVQRAVEVHGRNAVEALRLRIGDERWRAYNLQSDANLTRCIQEMADYGPRLDLFICEPSSADEDSCRLWVSSAGCAFARLALFTARDLPPLRRLKGVRSECDEALLSPWRIQLQHLADALSVVGNPPSVQRVVTCTTAFLLKQVVPICERSYAAGLMDDQWRPITELIEDTFPTLIRIASSVTLEPTRREHEDAHDVELLGDV